MLRLLPLLHLLLRSLDILVSRPTLRLCTLQRINDDAVLALVVLLPSAKVLGALLGMRQTSLEVLELLGIDLRGESGFEVVLGGGEFGLELSGAEFGGAV